LTITIRFVGPVSEREVHDEEPERHTNLGAASPMPGAGVHRLDHVVDEGLHVGCDLGHGLGAAVEQGLPVTDDRPDHGAGVS